MQLTTFIIIACTLYAYVLACISRTVRELPHGTRDDLLFIFMVPALNEELVIADTLTTLLALEGNLRVLILDDASDDRTGEIVRSFQHDPRVLLLSRRRPEARIGKGAALNAGVREIERLGLADGYGAENVIITVFDADARVKTDFLAGVTPYFADPKVAGVQAAVRMFNNGTNLLTFWQHMEFLLWGELFCRAKNRLRSATLGGNGQCVRLAALAGLGPDAWQSASLTEDLDLSLRLLAQGWQLRFCSSVAVAQEALPGMRRLVRQRARWVQGHIVCWRYLPMVLRSPLPLYTKVDLTIFMLMPTALPPVGAASVVSWIAFARNVGHWSPLGLVGLYIVGFSVAPLGVIAWRRVERPSLGRALLHIHLFFCNSFVWLFSCVGAVWNIFKGRRGWAKTSRVGAGGRGAIRLGLAGNLGAVAMVAMFLLPSLISAGLLVYQARHGAGNAAIPRINVASARARERFGALFDALAPAAATSTSAPTAPPIRTKLFPTGAPTVMAEAPPPDAAPSAVVVPSAVPPTPAPPPAPAALLARASEAQRSVPGGELQATLHYASGATTTATARFDLGDETHPASIQIVAMYRDAVTRTTLETVTVGSDGWMRQGESAWVTVSHPKSVRDQLRPFLFDTDAAVDPRTRIVGDGVRVDWLENDRQIDASILVDPGTGRARELEAVVRGSGKELTVVYTSWTSVPVSRPPGVGAPGAVTVAETPIDALWTL